MKIMIMTDMEGVAGVLNHDDWVLVDGRFYDKGMRLLTMETNAAIEGLFEGGATEVLVQDGHGQGGIDPELLEPRASLQRGWLRPCWPFGLDRTFDGLTFVGQHAKAGTPRSHITHTEWFDRIDTSVNGISVGEYGTLALCAMELGVPTILACGERALAEEAEELTPGVVAVAVKHGLLPDGLDELDVHEYRQAKLSAVHLSPQKARELIRDGAVRAMERLKEAPASFKYPEVHPPYVRVDRFRKTDAFPPHVSEVKCDSGIIDLINMPPIRPE